MNLFENHLNTARQNVALTRESLGEALVASQREPNNADLAETVEQLERELVSQERKLKSAEIAAAHAARVDDAATVEARKEAAQESAKTAHELLIREHKSYTDRQCEVFRALANLAGSDLQIVQARLRTHCGVLAKAATKGVRFEHERASEKFLHVSFFLLGNDLPEIKNAAEAIADAERNHKKVVEWADRALAESLAAINTVPANDKQAKRA